LFGFLSFSFIAQQDDYPAVKLWNTRFKWQCLKFFHPIAIINALCDEIKVILLELSI